MTDCKNNVLRHTWLPGRTITSLASSPRPFAAFQCCMLLFCVLYIALKIWEGLGTRLSLPILMQCLLYISRGTNFLACYYSWNSQSNAMTFGHLTVINCSCSLKSMYSTCTCLPCGEMFLYVEVYSRKPHAYVVCHCNIVDYA